jgi:DNA-binding HxlR family transcriptional regulator
MNMKLVGPVADRSAWHAERCSLDRTLALVGTRSAMLLMREAYYGTTRFDDFVDRVGITEAVASARLKELVDEGLLERRAYREPGQRTRSEYVLTATGTDLLPALLALMQWGDRHIAPRDGGPPLALRHEGCGEPVSVHVRCDAGHEVALDEIEVRRPRRSKLA